MSQRITVTLNLPDEMVERLNRQATTTHRTLDEVVTDNLLSHSPEALSLDDRLATLDGFTVEQLIAVVRQTLSENQKSRHEDLSEKMEFETISPAEKQELDALIEIIEEQMVLRSHALALLKERGEDIFPLTGNISGKNS